MPHREKARPAVESKGRAIVMKDKRIVPHAERERGMRMLWIPFAALLAAYVLFGIATKTFD